MIREDDIQFGAAKEHFETTMTAEVQTREKLYKVIIEPIHFLGDERIVTRSEHLKKIEALIEVMKRIIYHYNHMRQVHSDYNEEVRFLIAAENLEGMSRAVQMMNKYKEYFSGKVYFTTDRVLLETGSLANAVVAAREVPNREDDSTHLGLVKLSRDKLIDSGNKWLLEDAGSM